MTAMTDPLWRRYEFVSWALVGEEVSIQALTGRDVELAMSLAKDGFIKFNRVGATSYYLFAESKHTRTEYTRLQGVLAMRLRKAEYEKEAEF